MSKNSDNLYPLHLNPVLKRIIWGGNLLSEKYHKGEGQIAEAWELAVHGEGVCTVSNGEYAGMGLDKYLNTTPGEFPVMIKLIDARSQLSIQVHPAKTEMWYIVEAAPGAKLVYGLKDKFDETVFRGALSGGRVEELLNYVEVKAGEVYFIPRGLVHAIGGGLLIAEIQQNSNITYRVYDYGRLQNGKPRELHVEQAMKTIKDITPEQINALRYSKAPDCKDSTLVAACEYFTVHKYSSDGLPIPLAADNGFIAVVCIDGRGSIGGYEMKAGDTYFVPQGLKTEVLPDGKITILTTEA